ncbi:putative glutathione peroxidase, Thioredoxin-like superfamily [Helianthus annuus]|nr:putative glutathione peroxidase, Thioredoxin-like superfamily [Helianthus annuus]
MHDQLWNHGMFDFQNGQIVYIRLVFLKIRVNGPKAAPLYNFLKAKKGGFCGSRIKWNFTKFLVDKEGQVIGRYGTSTSPLSIEVTCCTPAFYIFCLGNVPE